MKTAEDFANGEIGAPFCAQCTDEFGAGKHYSTILKQTTQTLIHQMGINEKEAEKIAMENLKNIPHWARKQQLLEDKNHIIITDVGSTTTKALLLSKTADTWKISGIRHAPTTVEKPFEDVNIGVQNAITALQKATGITLLHKTAETFSIPKDTLYITTSSAGGGLQIVVIGLTMWDSAGSGRRAAYGAGGVILDTFAIDDKRSSLEQMKLMGILHPDIILMAGGVEGGAVSSILRLGEILQFANPQPKFGDKAHIPLIFAGNTVARPYIANLLGHNFDLFMAPNLRPNMREENLEPAREMIHRLFMDNVMEQAPGYGALKKKVSDDIIPTPTGVIRALQLLSKKLETNVLAVDIGGATTDIFSNIQGSYFRTVSANYGMSYSISNVLKEATQDAVMQWIDPAISRQTALNYIANKMLYPTFVPTSTHHIMIEHAVARCAINMSLKQHLEMNFNTSQIGFLDRVKTASHLERIREAFYFDQENERKKFHLYDIDVLIGSGGIMSHTQNDRQTLSLIYNGFRPEGITEIWRDRDFITPHLGKLSTINETIASELLQNECLQRIAITIRPVTRKWKRNQAVMKIAIDGAPLKIMSGEMHYLDNPAAASRSIIIEMNKGFYLDDFEQTFTFQSDLPLFIDTIFDDTQRFAAEQQAMQSYRLDADPPSIEATFASCLENKELATGKQSQIFALPYDGEILVSPGQAVSPDTLLGENRYDPPRIYVITLFDKTYLRLTPENLKESLLIHEGDEVKSGQRIVEVGRKTLMEELQFQHYFFESPVRGRVETINMDSGTVIMREIQDYSTKPKTINVAKKINVPPAHMMRYMKKELGEFVYAGEMLASRLIDVQGDNFPLSASCPTTGTISAVDKTTGNVTIQYNKEPYRLQAGIQGTVTHIQPKRSVAVTYNGTTVHGIIGFAAEASGRLRVLGNATRLAECGTGDVVCSLEPISLAFLQDATRLKVSGVIAPSMHNNDLISFLGIEIGVALTGNEAIPFPVLFTEGFGEFSMHPLYRDFLSSKDGAACYINGHTQIRAGVVRPKIVITQ